MNPPVGQSLINRLVRISQLDVLAYHCDLDLGLRSSERFDNLDPTIHVAGTWLPAKMLENPGIHLLLPEHQRKLVDRGLDILLDEDRFRRDIAEERNLLANFRFHINFSSAYKDVGKYPDLPEAPHRMLGGLGLDLAACSEIRK